MAGGQIFAGGAVKKKPEYGDNEGEQKLRSVHSPTYMSRELLSLLNGPVSHSAIRTNHRPGDSDGLFWEISQFRSESVATK